MARITATICVLFIQISGLFATSTPSKAYADAIYARMKIVWAKLAEERADKLSVGSVMVHFDIISDGRAQNVKVTSNTGNRALAELAIETIRETDLPPIPPALLHKLPRQRFTCDFEFAVKR